MKENDNIYLILHGDELRLLLEKLEDESRPFDLHIKRGNTRGNFIGKLLTPKGNDNICYFMNLINNIKNDK